LHAPGAEEDATMGEQRDCVIRRLQQSDVYDVIEIIRATRQEFGLERRVAALVEPAEYRLMDLYRSRRAAYFVAVEGAAVVGGAGIAPLAGGDWGTCELQKMYLRPSARGRGIGRQLLALALYARCGFRRLTSPLGLTGHSHNDCWLMLDVPSSGASL
jgi:putative acetyltransferase